MNEWAGVQPLVRVVDSLGVPLANFTSGIFPCSIKSLPQYDQVNPLLYATPVTAASYSFGGYGHATDANGYFQFGSAGPASFFGVTKGTP